jgi:hypothetical protein
MVSGVLYYLHHTMTPVTLDLCIHEMHIRVSDACKIANILF